MKSYILAIAITMFLSALYAYQNIGDVTVRFFVFEGVFPQGVWDVMLFAGGAVLMWIFSLFSGIETRGKYKKIIREKDDKITAAEKERAALLESLSAAGRNHDARPAAVSEGDQLTEMTSTTEEMAD